MKCKWCRGTGENRARYGPVMCPDCDGTGHLQLSDYDERDECPNDDDDTPSISDSEENDPPAQPAGPGDGPRAV